MLAGKLYRLGPWAPHGVKENRLKWLPLTSACVGIHTDGHRHTDTYTQALRHVHRHTCMFMEVPQAVALFYFHCWGTHGCVCLIHQSKMKTHLVVYYSPLHPTPPQKNPCSKTGEGSGQPAPSGELLPGKCEVDNRDIEQPFFFGKEMSWPSCLTIAPLCTATQPSHPIHDSLEAAVTVCSNHCPRHTQLRCKVGGSVSP